MDSIHHSFKADESLRTRMHTGPCLPRESPPGLAPELPRPELWFQVVVRPRVRRRKSDALIDSWHGETLKHATSSGDGGPPCVCASGSLALGFGACPCRCLLEGHAP